MRLPSIVSDHRFLRAFAAATLAASLSVACGGGGGGGDSGGGGTGGGGTGGGTGGGGTPSGGGALFYIDGPRTNRFDLSTQQVVSTAIGTRSKQSLGANGSTFTDAEDDIGGTQYTINLRGWAGSAFSVQGSTGFKLTTGFVSGPVQPSPNGTLFALHTRESPSLGADYVDYTYVLDNRGAAKLRLSGSREPQWLDNDRFVVAADSGLFIATVSTPSAAPLRIGAALSQPARPALSPDGKMLAFEQGDAVWRIGVDGSGLARVTLPYIGLEWASWSPDGKQLVMIRGDCPVLGAGAPNPDVVVVSATATDQNLAAATAVMRDATTPLRTCGPIYWR